jgi:hypothetical protein
MEALALAKVMRYTFLEVTKWLLHRKPIAVSVLGCVRRHELYARAVTPSPAPNPSRFSGVLEHLAKAPHSRSAVQLHSYTATQLYSHRSHISKNRLQLSCFKLYIIHLEEGEPINIEILEEKLNKNLKVYGTSAQGIKY